MVAPGPVKQPWRIWVNGSRESIKSWRHKNINNNKTVHIFHESCVFLFTHCGPVTRYDGIALGQDGLRHMALLNHNQKGSVAFTWEQFHKSAHELCQNWRHFSKGYRMRSLDTHYSGVIMGAMASPITGVSIVYTTVCSGADQRKHQCFASLAFAMGIHRWPVNSPHKGPVTQKMFPFYDVVMARVSAFVMSVSVDVTLQYDKKNMEWCPVFKCNVSPFY